MPTFLIRQFRRFLLAALVLASGHSADAQISLNGSGIATRGNSIPSATYFNAIQRMYKADYRDAERTFTREVRGALKIGVANRWLDSIAYYSLLGEVYYHQGRTTEALTQYDQACRMYLQNPNWMIRIQFQREPQIDVNQQRKILPWGKSKRQFTLGRFPGNELIQVFEVTQEAIRQGADSRFMGPRPFRQIDVIEINRALALAIRRRNELLGPLGPEDAISRQLVAAFSRGTTIPNHWSKAWADLQLGLAQMGVGKPDQAEKYLNRALLVGGQFDHPLTSVAMLELGRIQMEAGNFQAAADLFAEASYSAFYFEDLSAIDDAFQLRTMNHLASGPRGFDPLLEPAALWASQKRFHHLVARLNFALAEQAIHLGNAKVAQAALNTGKARMRDAAAGRLGNQLRYLTARLQFLQQRDSAGTALAQALQEKIGMSAHNLQLQLANQRYDQQQLRARTAVQVYQALLGDPSVAQWMLRPWETLARLKTPHLQAYNRWLDAVLSRKDMAAALEISDLAKRHRFHSSLAWGGRLAALRDVLEKPENLLSENARNQRNELLLRYPQYQEAMNTGRQLRRELSQQWQAGIDDAQQRELTKLWRQWDNSLDAREKMLGQIGLQRAAVDMQFPPILPTPTLQKKLQPGQAIAVFHDSPSGVLGFLLTSTASTSWQCAPKKVLGKNLSDFLRDLGNYDANYEVQVADLSENAWEASGVRLLESLFAGSSIDFEALEELIVVPDGLVWYVPLTALPIAVDGELVPLITKAQVRLSPTVGLAVGNEQPWRRVKRSGLVGQQILPGESEEEKLEALAALRKTVENPISFPDDLPAPTPAMGALTDTLIVLDEVELDLAEPLQWAPITLKRSSKQSSLSHWLLLPQFGPQRVILPGARTVAERGGKISKRKGASAAPGTELFLASCGLMSTGAQTILMSNWRVGGASTEELTREFLQELPYTTASAAWQRSVQLTRELQLDVEKEPRVKASKDDATDLAAVHPFFWAGYQLIDAGAPVLEEDLEITEDEAEPVAQLE